MRRRESLWVLVACAAGCTVDGGSFAGKTCNSIADCPAGYTCTEARGPSIRTCEVLYPDVQTLPGCAPSGPPLLYCGNIASILNAKCAQECHTNPVPSVPSQAIPDYFRLDQYADGTIPFPDGGFLLGAESMSQRVVVRAVCQRDMPPAGFPSLTQAERQALIDWGYQGALFCDGGVTSNDGGVSYRNQILPILDTPHLAGTCTQCHSGGSPPGGLDLTTVNPAFNIVNITCNTGAANATACNGKGIRVVPRDAGASILWLKVSNDPNKCGTSMPQGGPALDAGDQQLIYQWIVEGAPSN